MSADTPRSFSIALMQGERPSSDWRADFLRELRTWWHELRSSETRVRLPRAFTERSVAFMGDDRRVPVESIGAERWLAGSPSTTREAPVELVLSLDGGVMSPGLRFCWSLWTDASAPGRTLVHESRVSRGRDVSTLTCRRRSASIRGSPATAAA